LVGKIPPEYSCCNLSSGKEEYSGGIFPTNGKIPPEYSPLEVSFHWLERYLQCNLSSGKKEYSGGNFPLVGKIPPEYSSLPELRLQQDSRRRDVIREPLENKPMADVFYHRCKCFPIALRIVRNEQGWRWPATAEQP
jgi:hypothetical protein